MLARILKQRDRFTPDRATGAIVCELRIPSAEEHLIKGFTPHPNRPMAEIRHFVSANLPMNGIALEGGGFAISALVRKRSGGIERRLLANWRWGENIEAALEKAAAEWARLPKEEWAGEAVEVELGPEQNRLL
mgnify:CR=1 FL=1